MTDATDLHAVMEVLAGCWCEQHPRYYLRHESTPQWVLSKKSGWLHCTTCHMECHWDKFHDHPCTAQEQSCTHIYP